MASTRNWTVQSLVAAAAVAMFAGDPALAQSVSAPPAPPPAAHGDPRAQTLARMLKPITVEFTDARLEDIMAFIADVTGAPIDPKWVDDSTSGDGLDREQTMSLKVANIPAIDLVERVLEKAQGDAFSGNTWQLARSGELEVGPRSRLNRTTYLRVYDINDLLFDMPSFTQFPALDLDSVLNQREGGGAGSIFQNEEQDRGERESRQQRTQQIVELITTIVEPDQWLDNGGDAASIREYNGTLLVQAPDYVHRQIDGYPFWPSSQPRARGGGRYFTGAVGVQNSQRVGTSTQSVSGGTGGGGAGGAQNRTAPAGPPPRSGGQGAAPANPAGAPTPPAGGSGKP